MLQWVFYVLVVTALLSIAAWVAEHALRKRHWRTRWVWVSAMGLSVMLAYLSAAAWINPNLSHPLPLGSWHAIQRIAPIKLPQIISTAVTAGAYEEASHRNTVIASSWLVLSVLLSLMLSISAAHVFWRRRRWPLRLLCSACVGVAPDVGPAVVGLLRPTIVIPHWVLDRPDLEQRLILAHEQSHLEARDPLLLTSALGALLLMPWNVPLWWQLHRLRHAIEVDCDTRILRSGHDTRAYGEALIEVGQRRGGFVGTVAAMSESRTLLEKRIEIMTQHSRKPWTYGYAVLSTLAMAVAAGATQISSPEAIAPRQEISVDSATLDRYVGNYRLGGPYSILTFTRDGSLLNSQVTGSPNKTPVYAETPTTFFSKIVDGVEVTFNASDTGLATSLTIHQAGHDTVVPRIDDAAAEALEQQLATRVSQQTAQAGSEAALRKSIAAIQSGAPNYDDMAAPLQEAARRQEARLGPSLQAFGPVQAVEFKGVGPAGTDHYVVTYQSGKQSQWMIMLDADGKIYTLLVQPRF